MGWEVVDSRARGPGPGRNMVSTVIVGKLGGYDQVSPSHLSHIQTAGTLPWWRQEMVGVDNSG